MPEPTPSDAGEALASSPVEDDLATPADPALARARELVLAHGWNATVYQILNPGIERWLDARGEALVGYVEAHGHRVVAGSPVCAEERLAATVEAFENDTHRRGLRACYFAAGERLAAALAARGPFDRLYLGAQPSWDPRRWAAIVGSKASLRAQLHRARNKGVAVRRWTTREATAHPELERLLGEWLAGRGLPPLHFLVEPWTLERLYDRRVFVAERAGRPVAFLVASPVPRRGGWLVEQNVRGLEAPNGSTELLLDAAMRSFAADGSGYATLGLSPLSRRAEGEAPRQSAWLRLLLGWMRAHGRRFYDFGGLEAYKAKFVPDAWEPIYAITGGDRVGPATLYAITAAFARAPPPLLALRALVRAARQELAWLRDR